MELKFRNKKTNSIQIDNSILSLQVTDEVLNNFIEDYEPVVIDNTENFFLGNTVFDEITLFNKYPEMSLVNDAMIFFEMDQEFFNKKINELSTTEKIFVNLMRDLSKADSIILFKNIFKGLDLNYQKKLIKLINYLKINYLIIICSDDVNTLYKLSDYSIVANEKHFSFDETDKIYSNVPMLLKNKYDVPDLSYITYKAKEEKNVKLFYSKDVRDVIKDIYKHV